MVSTYFVGGHLCIPIPVLGAATEVAPISRTLFN